MVYTARLMVMTSSEMLPLRSVAPEFRLPDVDGKQFSLRDFPNSKAYVVVFMCTHCPFVKSLRDALAEVGRECAKAGVTMVGINSNDFEDFPDDSPERMREETAAYGYEFLYLVDETQATAKAYQAACTPDVFVFDADYKLAYRGQFDASRPGNGEPVTGADLRAAIAAVVAGTVVAEPQVPSVGCNIKWRKGNEPDYFG